MNKPVITKCEYRDHAWHVTTQCGMNRKVLYGELERELATDGYVTHMEGEPIPFSEFVDQMNLKINRRQLWLRLELLVWANEVKRRRVIEVNTICQEPEPSGVWSRFESNCHFATQHHEQIERMQERIDFNNSINDLNAA